MVDAEKKSVYLMVSTYFPFPEEPWRCSFVYDQVKAIQEASKKYEVVIINPNYNVDYTFKGFRVLCFKQKMSGAWIAPHLVAAINVRKMWHALKRARIQCNDIAVAHGQLVSMGVYLQALKKVNQKIKTILQFQDPDPYGMLFGTGRLAWIKKIIYFRFYRNLVEKMDILVGISKNVSRVVREAPKQTVYNTYAPMAQAMRILCHCRRARIKVIYTLHNGVDLNTFNPLPKKLRHDGFVIGCVAVFREWKDQITLLRAVDIARDKIPGLKVRMVGVPHSGTMYSDCKKYIEQRKLPVEIISSMGHDDLPDFYRSLDLFVLPSYFEGFGCVFTEAWSCGTPFITCEGQAMDDLIYLEDRRMWLCHERDPEDLSRLIISYFNNHPEQRLSGPVDINLMVSKFMKEYKLI